MKPLNLIFDMETGDPDDALTLCFLVNHPWVNLHAVTVTPGTDEQIGLVRHILNETGIDIPVGSYRIGYDKKCVSKYYYKWLGNFESAQPDDEGYAIILNTLKEYPDTTLLTGAPLKNLTDIAETVKIKEWVAQGGFAGDNVVPVEYRLPKFEGRVTCPTFNFNGAPKTALALLASQHIKSKYLVSKNVCHGVVYDKGMHERFAEYRHQSAGMNLMYRGMETYLNKKPDGKKFHDPLALAVAIDKSVCEFAEVELFRQRGEWGSNLKANTNTFISIRANVDKMIGALVGISD